MLNKEKYAKEIIAIATGGVDIALKDNKPVSCSDVYCEECERYNCEEYISCSMSKLRDWADSEYEELGL